jgi:hypothetical protein
LAEGRVRVEGDRAVVDAPTTTVSLRNPDIL